ncbi:MAG TPA: hypothetical protein VH253_12470 [Phycisphaerae bacterium]|nr:hypothetical protein [Phycisphaerae bacterium]
MRLHRPILLLLLAASLLLAACVPERVSWSPDGSRAAVLGKYGLYFCDPSGKLSPIAIAKPIDRVAWLPDGKHIVVVRVAELATWNELVKFGAGLTDGIPEKAKAWRQKFVQAGADEAALKALADPLFADSDARLVAIYLRDNDPALQQDLGPDKWANLADLTYDLPICELYDVSADTPRLTATLLTGAVGWTTELRPAPAGGRLAIACWNTSAKPPRALLFLVSTTDPKAVPVALGEGCAFPDFAPDGKTLVCMHSVPNPVLADVHLGDNDRTISKLRFTADSPDQHPGAIVARDLTTLDTAREQLLATAAYDPMTRIRVAADGRVFFCVQALENPVAASIPKDQHALYVLPKIGDAPALIVPPAVQPTLGNQQQLFSLSPDARYLDVPSDQGQVSVLDLQTQKVIPVQPLADHRGEKGDDFSLVSIPAWRNNTQLTFVRITQPGSPEREVVLHDMADDSDKILSPTWSDEARADWLTPLP